MKFEERVRACAPLHGWGFGVLPEKNLESNALWWPNDVKFEANINS